MLRPLGNQVVVKEIVKDVTTAAGIILQQDKKLYETLDAEVIAVNKANERELKKGDTVLVDKAIIKAAKFGGVEYLIVPEDCIIAVVDKEKKK